MVMDVEKKSDNVVGKDLLSEDEAALYDRQIRLWGVEAQKRLNSSKVLIIGVGGVGAEAAKNIILGGVHSVTLLDNQPVSEIDAACQFLAPKETVGQNRAQASLNRAQALNPMVKVIADSSSISEKSDEYFRAFDVIIASGCTLTEIHRLNGISRMFGINFFLSDVFGFFGFIFLDLGEHTYKTEITKLASKHSEVEVIDGCSRYVSFDYIANIDWNLEEYAKRAKKCQPGIFGLLVLLEFVEKYKRKPHPNLRDSDMSDLLNIRDEFVEKNGLARDRIPDDFFENVFGELGPSSAITGGVLAQEVVKAVSKKDPPIVNLFLCNPLTGTGYVENFAD